MNQQMDLDESEENDQNQQEETQIRAEKRPQKDAQFEFQCSYCQEGFFDEKNLVTHTMNNHGQKPGKCPICISKPYGDPNYVCPNLLAHMLIRHEHNYVI